MNELDDILLDQLHSARKLRKKMKRAKKIMMNDPIVDVFLNLNEKKIEYFEYMIEDKTLLHKKEKKKKKNRDLDILARNPVYEWYRTLLYMTVFSYKAFRNSMLDYMSLLKKGKE